MNPNFQYTASIYRTEHTKYSTYMSDGRGRDKYILDANGGLCYQKPFITNPSTQMLGAIPSRNIGTKHPQTIRYHPNGTGRDAFIIANNGGFNSNYKELDYYFFNKQLRNYNKGRKWLSSSQRSLSPNGGEVNQMGSPKYQASYLEYLKTFSKEQKNLTRRLSLPKNLTIDALETKEKEEEVKIIVKSKETGGDHIDTDGQIVMNKRLFRKRCSEQEKGIKLSRNTFLEQNRPKTLFSPTASGNRVKSDQLQTQLLNYYQSSKNQASQKSIVLSMMVENGEKELPKIKSQTSELGLRIQALQGIQPNYSQNVKLRQNLSKNKL